MWESDDPNKAVTELLKEHLEVLSEENGRDMQFYSEFEARYEPGQELKWLSDYFVQALVLIRGDLGITDDDATAEVL